MEIQIKSVVPSVIKSIEAVVGVLPCKKSVQKLVYLIEQKGENLGFDYSIHFYGPYSADLDYEIRYLNGRGDIDVEITPTSHNLSVTEPEEWENLNENALRVIERFGKKSPSQLELLATTLYVERELSETKTADIIKGVQNIKGSKYQEIQIKSAIKELQDMDYFSQVS